ncbi:DUF3108 domain-containing protein [Thalassotalea sp. HSM 43]|uniref:DUF3108 domain-containing protein n=1 Tax=Thalassotalea sp. HSM 43 TaxID=2552945 RepID=UPI0010816BC2|nr:DUF3108 domain-containing protein [Thalassotalea sp. HSM 43]QBY05606.1 DUF3108 domain-containing protein [Thalassotalea sp. HSM 43]
MGSKFLSTLVITSSLAMSSAFAEQAPVSFIPDFTANYNIVHDGDIVGKAKRVLKNLPDGTVEFSYKTDIEWMIFSDHRKEFTTNRIVDGQVIPLSYKSDREGTGKDKYYHWSFDQEKSQAINLLKKKTKDIEWPDGLQSKLSYHLQSRFNLINDVKDFKFKTLSTSGKVKDYNYEYVGKEELMLPYGVVDTVKLVRRKPGSKQTTYAWFAPKLNYLMVKLHQIDGSFQQFQAELVGVASKGNAAVNTDSQTDTADKKN